eukprot:Sro658_g182720.2  (502) ;mRNA; r:24350-25855
MLSYTWRYTIGDIVATLQGFCEEQKLDPKRTYFWICCLCNNQHRVYELSQSGKVVEADEFLKHFRACVLGIGKVVCMMEPWQSPKYLTRVWCVFEIFTAIDNDCQVFICMPPQEQQNMLQAVVYGEDTASLYTALSNTRVELADASVENDKRLILQVLENHEGGVETTNARVNIFLRQWFHSSILKHLHDKRDEALSKRESDKNSDMSHVGSLYCDVGWHFRHLGKRDVALEVLQEGLELLENAEEYGNSFVNVLNSLSAVLVELGKHEESLVHTQRLVKLQEDLDGSGVASDNTAVCYVQLGRVLKKLERYEESLDYLTKAASIAEQSSNHERLENVYNHLSSLYLAWDRKEDALQFAKKRLEVNKELRGSPPEDTFDAYIYVGDVSGGEERMQAYQDALDLATSVYGDRHPKPLEARTKKAMALKDKQEYAAALEELREVLALQRVFYGDDNDQHELKATKIQIRVCTALGGFAFTNASGGAMNLPKTTASTKEASSST